MFTPKAPSQPSVPQAVTPVGKESTQGLPSETNPFNLPPVSAAPAWPLGSKIELHFYLSTLLHPQDVFSDQGKKEGLPRFVWNNIVRHLILRICLVSFKINIVFQRRSVTGAMIHDWCRT